jgi:hypothetical protein
MVRDNRGMKICFGFPAIQSRDGRGPLDMAALGSIQDGY